MDQKPHKFNKQSSLNSNKEDNLPLFRNEAAEGITLSNYGRLHLNDSRLYQWSCFAAAFLAIGVILLFVLGSYTRHAHVDGLLVPSGGMITITAPIDGLASVIYVHEGEAISSGKPLITLDGERVSATLGNTHETITRQLQAERSKLLDDIERRKLIGTQAEDSLRSRLSLLAAKLEHTHREVDIKSSEVATTTVLVDKLRSVQQEGNISLVEFNREQLSALIQKESLEELKKQILDIQTEIETKRQQLLQMPLDTQIEVSELQKQIARINQNLLQNEAQRSVLVSAPNDSMVHTLLIKPGQQVHVGTPLIALANHGDKLEAQLLVPSKSSGFIHIGQSVKIHYQAFPFEKFGASTGTVTRVSGSTVAPNELSTVYGVQISEPMYLVSVSLSQQSVTTYGKNQPLKPGLRLSAEIQLDRRRLIEWIFEPILVFTDSTKKF